MTDLDDRLRNYARNWRASQPPPSPLDADGWRSSRSRIPSPRRLRGPVIAVLGASAALLAVVVVASRSGDHSGRVATSGRTPVPIAKPPLLTRLPSSTAPIRLATGQTQGVNWAFYAKISPLNTLTAPETTPQALNGPGLCIGIQDQQESSATCDDPRRMPSLTLGTSSPRGTNNVTLLYGVTSVHAGRFRVAFTGSQPAVTVNSISDRALAGLWFFVTPIPPGLPLQVDALGSDGTPLLRNDPTRFANLPLPALPTPAPPGTYPVWPLDSPPVAVRDSAEAVARDFSTRALGVTGNTITADPSALPGGPTTVTIDLPATHRPLRVLAAPSPDRSWVLLQVGDQTQLRGITYLPNGQPTGPVMSIQAPGGATQANITERASDGLHSIHLTATDLHAGVAHLTGTDIHTVLIVYYQTNGAPIDALGGEF